VTCLTVAKIRDTGLWQKFFLKYAGRFDDKYGGKIWRNMR